MRIDFENPWPLIRWGIAFLVFAAVLLISYDQIQSRDVRIAKLEEENSTICTRERKNLLRISELIAERNEWKGRTEKAVELAGDLSQATDELVKSYRTRENIAKIEKSNGLKSSASEAVAPHEMTNEEKLAAYRSGGITGIPSQISSEIVRKASGKQGAFGAVFDIEREANGYFIFSAFEKTLTQMPIVTRDAMVAA